MLINCSHRPVIDFPALHDALTGGKIAGAGLDVFPAEPPSPSAPVLSLDNVVLTRHLAGASRETRVKQRRNAFDNVLRAARGRSGWCRNCTTWRCGHDRTRRTAAGAGGGDGEVPGRGLSAATCLRGAAEVWTAAFHPSAGVGGVALAAGGEDRRSAPGAVRALN
ncbi:MAG TPA: NAD(P)-dependent oxidoreductase [Acetobacteraceae bacterium]|nr:NAD(P)-dependent oxidoreductase [Acetobacteraceae bacterium]